MRARYAWTFICASLLCQPATAEQEEVDLPPLELLGYIADFSDEEEGWTDPESIDDLFSLGQRGESEEGSENEPGSDTVNTEQAGQEDQDR
jgi:hypothetical protein